MERFKFLVREDFIQLHIKIFPEKLQGVAIIVENIKRRSLHMVKVLFVCLGSRSPMAEAMFRDLVKREGLEHNITVDSAGTGDWHIGKPPHKGTQEILLRNQISVEGLTARQIESKDLREFDYIIAMDAENKKNIEKLKAENPKSEVYRLLDLVKDSEVKDVPDPYFTGNFDEVYELVEKGCKELLNMIKVKHNI